MFWSNQSPNLKLQLRRLSPCCDNTVAPPGRSGGCRGETVPQKAPVPDLPTDQFLEHPGHRAAHAEPPAVQGAHGHLQGERGSSRPLHSPRVPLTPAVLGKAQRSWRTTGDRPRRCLSIFTRWFLENKRQVSGESCASTWES